MVIHSRPAVDPGRFPPVAVIVKLVAQLAQPVLDDIVFERLVNGPLVAAFGAVGRGEVSEIAAVQGGGQGLKRLWIVRTGIFGDQESACPERGIESAVVHPELATQRRRTGIAVGHHVDDIGKRCRLAAMACDGGQALA